MGYQVDPAAAKLTEDAERLQWSDVEQIMKGSHLICESIQDDDMERWHLTKGGQIVR